MRSIAYAAGIVVAGLLPLRSFGADPWRLSADLAAGETYTDNVGLKPSGQAKSDWITEISPGLRWSGKGAYSSGDVGLRVQSLLHSESSQSNSTHVTLDGRGQYEAVENHVFVDASAGISRQRVSQFGATDTASYNTNNTTEVRTVSISPYVRWRLGDQGLAVLRYRSDYTDTGNSTIKNRMQQTWSANLDNSTAWGRLGWGFNAQSMRNRDDNSRKVEDDNATGTLYYLATTDLKLNVTGGRESNNYASIERENHSTYGGGFTWTPTLRTQISAEGTKRFFGWANDYKLRHRMRHVAFDFSYSRDVSSTSNQGTTYSGLYATFYNLLTDQYPDPAQRDQAVKALLAANNASSTVNYLSADFTLAKRWSATVTAEGVRNTVAFSLQRVQRSRLSSVVFQSDFSDLGTFDTTVERTGAIWWTSRLSPRSNFNLGYTYSVANGQGGTTTAPTSRHTNGVNVGLNTEFSPRTTGGLSYRYSRSTGSSEYRENAVAATLHHTF